MVRPAPKPSLENLQETAAQARVSDALVKSFMSANPLEIQQGTKIFAAVKALHSHGISGAPVVDGAGKIVGMVSEYDLLMQAATKDLAAPITFVAEVETLAPDSTLQECLILLYKKRYRRIPVVDSRKQVVGIISRMDVLNLLLDPPKSKKS